MSSNTDIPYGYWDRMNPFGFWSLVDYMHWKGRQYDSVNTYCLSVEMVESAQKIELVTGYGNNYNKVVYQGPRDLTSLFHLLGTERKRCGSAMLLLDGTKA